LNQITRERYEGLIYHLKSVMTSPEFVDRHRRTQKDFTRKRWLTFHFTLLFLLNMIKHALQDELDEFFKVLQQQKVAEPVVTKSAFSQARQKLKHTAFIELNQVQVAYYYQHFEPLCWQGFRLLAIDGSMSELPATPAIAEHFGVWHPHAGGTCPKARLSQLFDVLNKVTLDACISPKAMGERALAATHFHHLNPGDLLLLDRGYPAFWLFAAIREQGADFCARMNLTDWQVVRDFLASGEQERWVDLQPAYEARKVCAQKDLSLAPIPVRLVRVELPDGRIEVLVTSLLDAVRFPYEVFKELYAHRWPVEEDYKQMKSRLEVENWSGTTVEAIYQDFHATVFSKNLAAILAQPAQEEVQQQTKLRKYPYRVNMTNLISKLKDTILYLFVDPQILPLLKSLWKQMTRVIEPVRTGRSVSRKKSVKRKRYPLNYKSTR